MNYLTYCLNLEQLNSNEYYNEIQQISNKTLKKGLRGSEIYLNNFMTFIAENKIENLRSKEEYFIELLLIGIFIGEYKDNARAFKNNSNKIFLILNNMRKKELLKDFIDNIRGKLISKILIKKMHVLEEITIEDFKLLIRWLDASGDFKDEVIRLNGWKAFLETKDTVYSSEILMFCCNFSEYFYAQCKDPLMKYTKNVKIYLKEYKEKHNNKEDIIYCGKGEIQYFFNMVSAEIMNQVYKEKFLNSSDKLIFVPACMRQIENECLSKKGNKGYECIGCSPHCNVNILRKIGQTHNVKIYIIPHDTLLSNLESEENNSTGIIGVACVLNLVSGGWKAIRLGFIPQCVVLDYVGCSHHWLDNGLMTQINIDKLKICLNK